MIVISPITMFKIVKLLLIALIIFVFMPRYEHSDFIVFMDVGQGDAALVKVQGFTMLIDSGQGRDLRFKLGRYLPAGSSIDALVLTHPHRDHVEGAYELHESYKIDRVYYSPVCYSSALSASMEDYFSSAQLFPVFDTNLVARFEGVYVDITKVFGGSLLPGSSCVPSRTSNINNDSLVVRAHIGSFKALFMGDVESEGEMWLLESGAQLQADLLKAGHHCSHTSTTKSFLAVVAPQTVICSYGVGNSYGHPDAGLLDRLEASSIDVRHTAVEGDIIIYDIGL